MSLKERLIGAAVATAHVCEAEALPEAAARDALRALKLSAPDSPLDAAEGEALLERLHEVKYTYRESCRGCPHPCGRSKDFDLTDLDKLKSANLRAKKLQLLSRLRALPEDADAARVTEALRAFGYAATIKAVSAMLEKMDAEEGKDA